MPLQHTQRLARLHPIPSLINGEITADATHETHLEVDLEDHRRVLRDPRVVAHDPDVERLAEQLDGRAEVLELRGFLCAGLCGVLWG